MHRRDRGPSVKLDPRPAGPSDTLVSASNHGAEPLVLIGFNLRRRSALHGH
jgi:hypothetical protein